MFKTPGGFRWEIFFVQMSSALRRTSFSYFYLWRLVIFEPVGVQRPYVPHLKALICGYLEPEVQGRGSTLSIDHALLKIGVLYGKSRFSDLFFPPLYYWMSPTERLIAVLDTGIRCHRYHWTTADTGAHMKVVCFTARIFAVQHRLALLTFFRFETNPEL